MVECMPGMSEALSSIPSPPPPKKYSMDVNYVQWNDGAIEFNYAFTDFLPVRFTYFGYSMLRFLAIPMS